MRAALLAFSAVALATAMSGTAWAEIETGDQMVVAKANAPVMRGHSTLAMLPAGHRFQVLRTEGDWVGMRTNLNGQAVSGWLWQGHVATPRQFAARRATRRYSYQPGMSASPNGYIPSNSARRYSYSPAVPGMNRPSRGPDPYARDTLWPDMGDYVTGGLRANSPLVIGRTKYGRNYWRADRKIIGY